MDVYGFPAYQYNPSSELAKQMYAHQALGGADNRDTPQPHAMPVPSGSTWDIQGIPWGMTSPPQLVQFTGQGPEDPKYTPVIHCKRKNLEIEPVIPAKQLITEEKMAAHLSGMHISSEYTQHSLATQGLDIMDVGMDAVTSVSEKVKGHTLVLSEEIKKLKDEPLIPASLIERLEKPCMSLMVWKPKEDIIEKTLNDKEENKPQDDDEIDIEPTKRHGVLVSEYNTLDSDMDVEM